MAKPQFENGHIKIANVLVSSLARHNSPLTTPKIILGDKRRIEENREVHLKL